MIYEYSCIECNQIWEDILPVSKMEKPLNKPCPYCEAKKGSVYRHFSSTPAMKMDANYKINEPHCEGGFQEAMKRVINSPGVKGTPEAEKLKEKHIG
tara:strand:- start:416 stop:706 length:291 start_codon:yes stop_codon:yes gene_type:complete